MGVWHKAEHCDEITFFSAGIIPAFRLKLMTETQKSIHHSDESDLPREEQALSSETLPHSLAVSHVQRAAGCSAISPRGIHKSLCWPCPLWPFISAIKPSCCPPVLTQKTPCTSSQALIALADDPSPSKRL